MPNTASKFPRFPGRHLHAATPIPSAATRQPDQRPHSAHRRRLRPSSPDSAPDCRCSPGRHKPLRTSTAGAAAQPSSPVVAVPSANPPTPLKPQTSAAQLPHLDSPSRSHRIAFCLGHYKAAARKNGRMNTVDRTKPRVCSITGKHLYPCNPPETARPAMVWQSWGQALKGPGHPSRDASVSQHYGLGPIRTWRSILPTSAASPADNRLNQRPNQELPPAANRGRACSPTHTIPLFGMLSRNHQSVQK